jgi:hypothetical protein
MRYTVQMASDGMTYVPSFTKVGWYIQVILRLLPQQFERLQCWYYLSKRFMMHGVQMASGGMIYTRRSMTIG